MHLEIIKFRHARETECHVYWFYEMSRMHVVCTLNEVFFRVLLTVMNTHYTYSISMYFHNMVFSQLIFA